MFTGLIETVGNVVNINSDSLGARLSFSCDFREKETVKIGDSVSVNGACLTVTSIKNDIYTVEVIKETLGLTNIKNLKSGDTVNLERAMKADSRLDGHLVSGHIDTVATVKSVINDGFSKKITFNCNTDLIILKGSIAVNGVSLTVSGVNKNDFEVSLIPTTLKETNLENLKTDDIVNIEYDLIGKYVNKFLNKAQKSNITEEFLKENGFC